MNKPLITVIVAVYNAQKTLVRLTDSLKAQTMPDFEVLLIDDGSTDSSGSLCDSIAHSDSRFKVFHKQNEGVGSTRQFGIMHSSGEYTIHADPDDWVEPDYLELLYEKAVSTGADMVICDILEERGKKTVYRRQEPSSYDNKALIQDLLHSRIHGSLCNKLIKLSCYTDNGINFESGSKYGEDKIVNMKFLSAGISVAYLPKALYHYDMRANPDSAVKRYTPEMVDCRIHYVDQLRALLPQAEYKEFLDNMYLEAAYIAIRSKMFSKEDYIRRFGFLSGLKYKSYLRKHFDRLIIWGSLHFSYRLSLFLGNFKNLSLKLKDLN